VLVPPKPEDIFDVDADPNEKNKKKRKKVLNH
jgi:hypothetical protein